MQSSVFFKIFPPPKYLLMRYSGLHIGDDGIRFIEFNVNGQKTTVGKYAFEPFPKGLIVSGDVKDYKKLQSILKDFDNEHDLSYAKITVPEEKAYLFKTEVPDEGISSIEQNIEFKLEENVPLTAADAVFYFDILEKKGGNREASVSVVPKVYIEQYIAVLRDSGIFPVAFEVLPKAVARSVIPKGSKDSAMIVNVMKEKTGIYAVAGEVVGFSSTITWGSESENLNKSDSVEMLTKEITRVITYWASHEGSDIKHIYLVGKGSLNYEEAIKQSIGDLNIKLCIPDIWQNFFNVEEYLPPITKEDSLDFAAAAALAFYK